MGYLAIFTALATIPIAANNIDRTAVLEDGACSRYSGLLEGFGRKPKAGMSTVSGGNFRMGSDHHFPEERPARQMTVPAFWIDSHEVTNTQLARFVAATGHVTVAERAVDASRYPGAPADLLQPGGFVFHQPEGTVSAADFRIWWR